MGIEGSNYDDDGLDGNESAEEMEELIHLPPNATMQDLFDAEGLLTAKYPAALSLLNDEVLNVCDDDAFDAFLRMRTSPKTKLTTVVEFFGVDTFDLPIVFDVTAEQWEKAKADNNIVDIPPKPVMVPNEQVREEARAILAMVFADVDATLLPDPVLEAIIASRDKKSYITVINEARVAGVSDPHVRQFMARVCSEKVSEGQYGLVGRFLESMVKATPEQFGPFTSFEARKNVLLT